MTWNIPPVERRSISCLLSPPTTAWLVFLRLSLPGPSSPATGMPDLDGAAIIREVHIYGQSLPVGAEEQGAAQHIGLGSRLIQSAQDIARSQGYRRLAVISAIGTRRYYQRLGFQHGELYMVKDLE